MYNKAIINSFKSILWTHHARFKMNYYKLSEARIRKVLHSPKRVEDGVAIKTIAVMQPSSIKFLKNDNSKTSSSQKNIRFETWSQEIWVMFQDLKDKRVIISAWRFPGMSKQKSSLSMAKIREEYDSFIKESLNGIKK